MYKQELEKRMKEHTLKMGEYQKKITKYKDGGCSNHNMEHFKANYHYNDGIVFGLKFALYLLENNKNLIVLKNEEIDFILPILEIKKRDEWDAYTKESQETLTEIIKKLKTMEGIIWIEILKKLRWMQFLIM